uniref:Uncharacterized protein n=1 Tax=Lygus hesperus TaxID=30085 RepID=A0A0K8SJZ7_LYGHE
MGCKPSKDMIKKVVNPVEDEASVEPEVDKKTTSRMSRQSAQDEGGESQVIPLASGQHEDVNQAEEPENQEEEEKAAVAIQAAFRGYQTRKEIQSSKMASDEPTKQQLEAEFSADDKELCHAATKIQASFRGHQARKDTATSSNAKVEELSKDMQKMAQEEELDIDLTDPELHKAATKIQASFRGHKRQK